MIPLQTMHKGPVPEYISAISIAGQGYLLKHLSNTSSHPVRLTVQSETDGAQSKRG